MNERMLELYKQAHVPGTAIDPSNNMPYATTHFSADKFAELIGRDMLKLANRHGNIKKHSINEYFGFEKDFGINTNNIKRFVNERTNYKNCY